MTKTVEIQPTTLKTGAEFNNHTKTSQRLKDPFCQHFPTRQNIVSHIVKHSFSASYYASSLSFSSSNQGAGSRRQALIGTAHVE